MKSDDEKNDSDVPRDEERIDDVEDDSHADDQSLVASNTVGTEDDSHADDDRSMATAPDDDDEKSKSTKDDDGGSRPETPSSATAPPKKKRKVIPPSSRKGRAPAVKGLTIPFRTVKKAMKLDPDIPIVQNEAAIMTTMAAELFLSSLAKESHRIAKGRGRNTIRYEDVAEARTNDSSLSFLKTLLP